MARKFTPSEIGKWEVYPSDRGGYWVVKNIKTGEVIASFPTQEQARKWLSQASSMSW